MNIFGENEGEAFITWIENHPEGFFINRKSPSDVLIHRATCGHLKPYEGVKQTSHLKVCSLDRRELEKWSEIEGVAALKICHDCKL